VKGDDLCALIVADGVGGCWRSELASETAALGLRSRLISRDALRHFSDAKSIARVLVDLTKEIRERALREPGRPDGVWPATTLIAVIYERRSGELWLFYAGDGTVWFIRGDRQEGMPLLLPTANRAGGLLHILYPQASDPQPVVMRIGNVRAWPGGGLIIIGTDGVPLSDPRGLVDRLYKWLRGQCESESDLGAEIQQWLDEQRISDDATLGVLLPKVTQEWWERER